MKTAYKTELKIFNDYQSFQVTDSVELIPNDYQKIPYHIVFDVRNDLRQKSKVTAGGNWTVNKREAIATMTLSIA
jgi:hypothetical protein